MKRVVIVEIISVLFKILFLYTGISKLMDYTLFKEQLYESPLLKSVAPMVALLLPVIEILVAVLLFIPRTRPKGLYASLILMILFLGYVVYLVMFNDKLPCSCGGVLQQLSWKGHILFNAIFTLLASVGIILQRGTGRHIKTASNFSHPMIQ